MEITIIRSVTAQANNYEIVGDPRITGTANQVLDFLPIRIKVCGGEHSYEMFQRNRFLCALTCFFLPLRFSGVFPLIITENGQKVGYHEKFYEADHFYLGTACYELRFHGNDLYSLMENDVQVAIFRKQTYTYAEHHTYTVTFHSKDRSKMELFLLLCIFIDIRFYGKSEISFALVKYEKKFLLGEDEYAERAKWKPEL